MNCQRAQLLMEPERRDAMSPSVTRGFHAHLSSCEACAAVWQEELDVCAHLATAPQIEPPAGLEAALLALPTTIAPTGSRTSPATSPRRDPSGEPDAMPMTLSEWLRTFMVLLALGTLAGLGGADRGRGSIALDKEGASSAQAPEATVVARRSPIDLARTLESADGGRTEAMAMADLGEASSPPVSAAQAALATLPPLASVTSSPTESRVGKNDHRANADHRSAEESQSDTADNTDRNPTAQPPPTPNASKGEDGAVPAAEPTESPTEVPLADVPAAKDPPAHRLQIATLPLHVFADVGGADVIGCRGCDGQLSQADRDVAGREGLILPPFQISVEDDTGVIVFEQAFVPDGFELHAALDVAGAPPFKVRIYVQSETWLPCANLDITEQVAAPPLMAPLRFPLVDRCPPAPRPEPEDPPEVATPRGVDYARPPTDPASGAISTDRIQGSTHR